MPPPGWSPSHAAGRWHSGRVFTREADPDQPRGGLKREFAASLGQPIIATPALAEYGEDWSTQPTRNSAR